MGKGMKPSCPIEYDIDRHILQELEDEFDQEKRMNLRHFIHQEYHDTHVSGDDDGLAQVDYYFLPTGLSTEKAPDYRRLQVINTCAIFHKISTGKGVPHGFISEILSRAKVSSFRLMKLIGLLRQWPALPRVVVSEKCSLTENALCSLIWQIFLCVSVAPTAHIPPEQRYAVTKVRTVPGMLHTQSVFIAVLE